MIIDEGTSTPEPEPLDTGFSDIILSISTTTQLVCPHCQRVITATSRYNRDSNLVERAVHFELTRHIIDAHGIYPTREPILGFLEWERRRDSITNLNAC